MDEKSQDRDVLELLIALGPEKMILKTNHDCEGTITDSDEEIKAA